MKRLKLIAILMFKKLQIKWLDLQIAWHKNPARKSATETVGVLEWLKPKDSNQKMFLFSPALTIVLMALAIAVGNYSNLFWMFVALVYQILFYVSNKMKVDYKELLDETMALVKDMNEHLDKAHALMDKNMSELLNELGEGLEKATQGAVKLKVHRLKKGQIVHES